MFPYLLDWIKVWRTLHESHCDFLVIFCDCDFAFAAKPTESCHNFVFLEFSGFLKGLQSEYAGFCILKRFVNFTGPGAN